MKNCLWIAGRRDSTVFGVVDDTTTTKFVNRACAVHGISLPVVVVVLKFPNDENDDHMMMMMDINIQEVRKNFDVDGEPSKRFYESGGFVFFLYFIFSLFGNYKHLLLFTEHEIILSRRGHILVN